MSNRKRYEVVLTRYDRITGSACTYCGDTAGTIDHVPPVSWGYAVGTDAEGDWVAIPCCKECNSALGERGGNTVGSRAEYMARWIRRRYRQELSMPDWSVDDLDELGKNLRSAIEDAANRRLWATRRLDHLRSVYGV